MTAGTVQETPPAAGTAVAAVVDGQEITTADVARRVALVRAGAPPGGLPAVGTPEDRRLRRWVVQTLVAELLVEQEASRAGWPARRKPGDPLADEVVVAVFELVTGHVEISDSEVARYYAANERRYERPESRTVHQVVVPGSETARSLAALARARGLANAARSVAGPDAEAAPEVEPAEFKRGSVGGRLEERVFDAGIGTVLEPVRTPAGWHVVEVIAAAPASVSPLASVADEIRADLLAAARGEAFDRWLSAARRRRVRLMPGHEHPGDSAVPDAVHRH